MRFVFDNHIAGDHITSFVDSDIRNFSNPKLYLARVVTIYKYINADKCLLSDWQVCKNTVIPFYEALKYER